jgi:hypothetical protein
VKSTIVLGISKSGTTGHYQMLKGEALRLNKNSIALYEPKKKRVLDTAMSNIRCYPVLAKVMMQHVKRLRINHVAFTHKIAVVRDPRDLLVSLTMYRPMISDLTEDEMTPFMGLLAKKVADPSSISLREISELGDTLGLKTLSMEDLLAQYVELHNISQQHGYILSRYEDFVTGNNYSLEKYVGCSLNNEAKVAGWTGHVVRSKKHEQWKDWMTDEDVEYYSSCFDPILDLFGYSKRWSLNEESIVDSKDSIDYLKQGLKRYRQEKSVLKNKKNAIKTDVNLNLALDAASDGSVSAIIKVANYYLSQRSAEIGATRQAVYWLERGVLLGCVKAARKLLKIITVIDYITVGELSIDEVNKVVEGG